jgi:hypothetical protein
MSERWKSPRMESPVWTAGKTRLLCYANSEKPKFVSFRL